jgi:hypothetical protein
MEFLVKAIGVVGLVFIISTLGGFIVWGCWDSLTQAFPTLPVPQELSLWTSIKLSWLFGALIRASNSTSSSSK